MVDLMLLVFLIDAFLLFLVWVVRDCGFWCFDSLCMAVHSCMND